MNVLGIHDGQTSGAAVVSGGRLVAAVNEERLVRMKLARGFPRRSIAEALRIAGLEPDDVDRVAFAHRDMEPEEEVSGWNGWFEERRAADGIHARFFRIASRYAGMAERIPVLKRLYYALRTPLYALRRRGARRILEQEFGITAPVDFHHHHYSHAAAAYHASGFGDALVVTMDGGGDGHSSHVYSVRDGRWTLLKEVDAYDSLGNWYAYVTALCGFKAMKHEGKITGLAARGRPRFLPLLREMVGYRDGGTVNLAGELFEGAMELLRRRLPEDWTREDLAASIQALSEELARRHVVHWLERTGHDRVALVGGLFANVCINQAIHEIPLVEDVFVFPGMTDEGLSPGAAWASSGADRAPADRDGRRADPEDGSFDHVYLGPEYPPEAMERALRGAGLEFERREDPADAVARRLADGQVVARYAGRMEFGPRALGNRSILYQPTDPSVQRWLNDALRRTEFMPFAPSVLAEEADRCFEEVEGARDTARFMTITFRCTEWMREHCPGVVHVDGTARPQLVRREDNPSYWAVIDRYREITGLPVIINTSFNMHEEPIVCSPADAVRAFVDSGIDCLAMGPFLARQTAGAGRERPARGQETRVAASDG